MAPDVDVVVVGGRVAGALTALRLAAHGVSVRVLEAHRFPSDTLSTHFFRGDGLVRSLDEVGVLDEVLASGAPPLRCEYNSEGGGPLEQGPPQDPGAAGFCLSVRRVTLDAILWRRCERSGVDARAGVRVREVIRDAGSDGEHDGGRVVGVVDDAGETHTATAVVGADGRRSPTARLVGAGDDERHPAARAMYYRYAAGWRSPEDVGPEFSLAGNELLYVFPSDGDCVCIAISLPVAEHEQHRQDPGGHLDRRLAAHRVLADRLEAMSWTSRVFVGQPADSLLRTASGEGWALVGDAGTGQDPWAGLGMDTAARQAEAFAEAFTAHRADWPEAYARLRAERTLGGFQVATRYAPDLGALLD